MTGLDWESIPDPRTATGPGLLEWLDYGPETAELAAFLGERLDRTDEDPRAGLIKRIEALAMAMTLTEELMT